MVTSGKFELAYMFARDVVLYGEMKVNFMGEGVCL